MNSLENEFLNVAITHLNMFMYYPKDALFFIKRCKELNKIILGIDAFIINGERIQPCMEHSVDFSIIKSQPEYGFWEESKDFIEKRMNNGYVFEIVLRP